MSSKSELMRLLDNLNLLIVNEVLDDNFKIFNQEEPNLDSIEELNELIESEISYWGDI